MPPFRDVLMLPDRALCSHARHPCSAVLVAFVVLFASRTYIPLLLCCSWDTISLIWSAFALFLPFLHDLSVLLFVVALMFLVSMHNLQRCRLSKIKFISTKLPCVSTFIIYTTPYILVHSLHMATDYKQIRSAATLIVPCKTVVNAINITKHDRRPLQRCSAASSFPSRLKHQGYAYFQSLADMSCMIVMMHGTLM